MNEGRYGEGRGVVFDHDYRHTWLAVAAGLEVSHSNELLYSADHSHDHNLAALPNRPAAHQRPPRSHSLLLLGEEQRSGICRIGSQDSAAGDAPSAGDDDLEARDSH